jgi:DNA/RNA endonuclease G (NUC1)
MFPPSRSRRRLLPFVLAAFASACAGSRETPLTPQPSEPAPSVAAEATPTSTTRLIIAEIMSDPATIADADGEWFEIHNPGATDVDLNGYRVNSGSGTSTEGFTINTPAVVPAGGYRILLKNGNSAVNGGLTGIFAWGAAINLANNATDWLEIRDVGGALIDRVDWGATPPTAVSRAKRAMVIDCSRMNDNASWGSATTIYTATGSNRGTPNAANDVSGYTGTNQCATGGAPATVTVTPNPGSATVGGTRAFAAAAVDAAGVPTTTTFTWSSSNPLIATVSTTGVATGLALGAVTITATAANGVTGTATLNVIAAGSDIATVSVGGATIPVGFQTQVFGTARDGAGVVVPNVTFTWSVDPADVSRLRVDANGVITGLAAGTARVIATAPNGVTGSATVTIEGPAFADPSIYGNHLEFGQPTDADPSDDFQVRRAMYAASWNRARGVPNWVAYNLDAGHFGAEDRCNCFSEDPIIVGAGFPAIRTSDYTNGGFDRGHMVRSSDRTQASGDNASTFYLTNVVPQTADLNQGVWNNHEQFLQDQARLSNKELYIVTGPVFTGPARTLKDEGKVRIPDFTFKVAIVMDRNRGLANITSWNDLAGVEVNAVLMPNIAGIRTEDWRRYVVTVDSIERVTGYDFLALLPDAFEAALEAGDRAPTAVLTGPTSGTEGSALAFSGAGSTDPDAGDVLTYSWSFGDGSTATGATPSKTYSDNGTYTVTLTVRDRFGWESTATRTVTISNAAPVAALTTAGSTTIAVGQALTTQLRFTDPGTQDATWRVRYEWGDGTTFNAVLTAQLPTTPMLRAKAWSAPGSYTVRVTVTDKDGAVSTSTLAVTVTP